MTESNDRPGSQTAANPAAGHVHGPDCDHDHGHHHVAPVRQVMRDGRKIGRNEVCPCGSGKKYKKCCMAA